MALGSIGQLTFPNSQNSNDSTTQEKLALVIEEFTGLVEGTIERRSILDPHIPVRSVRGTATFTNYAIGGATIQKVTPGTALDGVKSDFSRNNVTVDTVMATREFLPLLDVFQTQFDVRSEIATEQGKEISKFRDNAYLIQAIRAGLATNSSFYGGTSPANPKGHAGGYVKTLGSALDENIAAKVVAGLDDIFVAMALKDVDIQNDDLMIVCRPQLYYTLLQSEQLINANYITAAGNAVNNGWVLKTRGVPVYMSNNLPTTNITSHALSNANNSNAYNVDATKVQAVVFSPRAIMAGETIPVQSDIFYDKLLKSWVVDSHLSFAVGVNRAEYAAVLKSA